MPMDPWPANVVMRSEGPNGMVRRMTLLPESAMYMFPSESNATSVGKFMRAKVASRLSPS